MGEPLRPGLAGAEEAVLFHQPLAVVGVHKAFHRLPHLLEILEHPAVDGLLFKGPDEAFGHAVGLWWLDKGEAGADTPVLELAL